MEINILSENKSLQAKERNVFHVLVQVKIPATKDKERIPLNLSLALDRSGSMNGQKLNSAKASAESFVRWMTRKDYFSLIAYDSEVDSIVSAIQLTDKEPVIARIHTIAAEANTNLSGGWIESIKQIEGVEDKNCFKRVILLTDGQANEGITDHKKLIQLAEKYNKEGISLTCIGYGRDFDEKLLKDLSQAGGGNFHYIKSAEEAPNIFFDEFGKVSSIVGQNGSLDVTLSEGVKAAEVLTTSSYKKSGDHYSFAMGDVLAESMFQVILVLECDSFKKNTKAQELFSIKSSYFDVATMDFVEDTSKLELPIGKQEATEDNSIILTEAVLARKSKMVLEAIDMSSSGKDEQATILLASAIDLLQKNKDLNAERLSFEIINLEQHLELLKNRYGNEFRKSASASRPLDLTIDPPLAGSGGARNIFVKQFRPNTELDLYNAPEIRDYLYELANEEEAFSVIFDMKNVNYIDSSGIGTLISSFRSLQKKGGLLVLASLNKQVYKILQMCQLDSFIKFFDSVQEARDFLEGK